MATPLRVCRYQGNQLTLGRPARANSPSTLLLQGGERSSSQPMMVCCLVSPWHGPFYSEAPEAFTSHVLIVVGFSRRKGESQKWLAVPLPVWTTKHTGRRKGRASVLALREGTRRVIFGWAETEQSTELSRLQTCIANFVRLLFITTPFVWEGRGSWGNAVTATVDSQLIDSSLLLWSD